MKRKSFLYILLAAVILIGALAMGPLKSVFEPSKSALGTSGSAATETAKYALEFNADSAYAFTAAQCEFGPRSMNSQGHEACKAWIIDKFQEYGCEVMTQEAVLTGYDGTKLNSTNIIARHLPEAGKRIMLCAHWDSRPWADNDADEGNWKKPIIAANDAASGVAVMLEIARLVEADTTLQVGIDFVCFDAEDWGTPQWETNQMESSDSWALGAQYFSRNMPLHPAPQVGILLDMVGGEGATFYMEAYSLQYAKSLTERIWNAAREVGESSFFPYQEGGMITDDHVPLNTVARIPTVDIIPYHPNCRESSFGPTWHTMADDMSIISKRTLKAVGQTVVQVIGTY